MFVNRPALGDFKENVMSLAPGKTVPRSSQKGPKGQKIKCFSDSTNLIPTKKSTSGLKVGNHNSIFSAEKENSKPQFKEPAVKVKHIAEEDTWPEIEKMHIYVEPEDDYEDIMPKHERIQKKDPDSIFFTYTFGTVCPCLDPELTVDNKPPSPSKDCETLDFEIFSPVIPEITTSLYDDTELLYDDTELHYIPLPDGFPNF